jgi:hypothetical protein
VKIGKAVIGKWGRIGLVTDLYGLEEFGRIFTYATVTYAEGDSEELPVDGLEVY